MTSLAVRRITKEIPLVNDLSGLGIYYYYNPADVMKGYALIWGPEETPYAFCPLFFQFQFTHDYPFSPPKVKFLTSDGKTRFHPNLYVDGKVCLSILGTFSGPSWQSTMSLSMILLSLKALLDSNPLTHEPGFEKVNISEPRALHFSQYVQHQMIQLSLNEFRNRSLFTLCDEDTEEFNSMISYNYRKLKEIIDKKRYSAEVSYTYLPYGMVGKTEWNKLHTNIVNGAYQINESST
jgi:ubiquitin-conjugating enzyme E2 Z